MIHVIARITAKPGQRGAILEAFARNRPNVLAEEGCLEYGAVIDAENGGKIQSPIGSDTFLVIEKWSSLETLQAHGASAHMAAYAAETKEWLEERVIHVLSPVS